MGNYLLNNLSNILQSSNHTEGITFITPKEEFLSYGELYSNSLKLLGFFNDKGLKKNSKLIFQLSSNKNFVNSFWACIVGGVVAVPVSTGNNDEHRLKLFNIYALLDDAYLIIDSDILDRLESFAQKNSLMDIFLEIKSKTIDIRDINLETLSLAKAVESDKDDLALIQFSSGSTGEPKGVMISGDKIIQNAKGFLETAKIDREDSYLSWFPLTHDMGLMGWHINPLILGVNQVLIETNVFIRRPLIWLESATKYKSSILCSPNFGYRYLLQFLKKEQNWDLSHIRLIFNGAEPISSTLCDEFLERLEPYGLKSEAMYPVYGLAEATLAVAFPKPNEMFRRYILDINHLTIGERVKDLKTDMGSVTYVDVGYPLTNMQIRITDDRVLDENFIGHIEIKSISVTDGYYNNPKATSEVIKDDGWLDTGDLGFMRDGRLIITGRAKDIIIKNGANYYPHDIEDICCEINGCELNKVVAIGRRDTNQEDEEIIVFVLFKKDLKEFLEIESEIKKVVLNKIGLEVSKVIPVKTIYKTTSGKLQRYKFLQKYSSGEYDETIKELANFSNDFTISKDDILSTLKVEAEEILDSSIEMDKPLFEQGFSSISLVSYKNKIAKKLNIEIDITTIFDYPTLNALANYLCSNPSITDEQSEKIDNNIAIVSSACIFPDASNPEEFFDNLLQGVDSIQKSSRWTKEYYGGFLSDDVIDRFDNEFFNISPAEANSLDPQVKILLQTSLDLLERGAVDYQKEKNIGLFIGVSSNDNLRLSLGKELTPYTLTSNLNSTLSGRVSYFFDFNAPAISIDTACSSSLVAISQAINAIKSGDCKMAIAGGVNVILDAQTFEGLSQIHALSPTNRCKTFDESGDGYVRGEGCGLILLKPLQSAIDDRDEILGVIKSATINHDGKSNGLTAPNGLSQQNLLKKAYSGIDRVDFIETHGTGTKLGDPIELNALSSVFKNQKIMLGAVKTNIGHLESSAGVAGVIKTLMAIKYKKLPANLHLKDKNSFIDWDKIKLSPLTKNLDWISDKPKVAGISSFGFSGTNAHIVLEEFIDKPQRVDKEYKILLVSAKDNQSVDKLSHLYIENLTKDNLENFIFSTSKKYKYNEKIAIVGADLEDFKSSKNIFKSSDREDLKTIFVFTGQGSQYPNMAKELFDNEPIFRKYFIECDNIFKKYLSKSLVDVVYKEAEEVLNEPIYTQSSLFAVEYAIAKYLIDLNIIPDGVTGHSLGEYVGAVISGVLSLEDAIKLVLVRSKLISSLDIKGSMYLFMTTEDIVFNAINSHYDKLSIASVNALNRVVVSGEDKALIEVVNELEAKGIKSIKLNINHPYHSVLLDTLLFDFYYEASKITYDKPNIAFISAMRATQVETIDANYFVTHFRNSVRFADTISYLNAQNFNTFIEIGADAHLSPLIIGQSQNVKVISTLRKNRPLAFYEGLANLYINHFDINWDKFYMDYGDKIPTPTHPMRESRFEINYANQMVQSLPNITKPKKTTINSMEKLKESIYQVSGIKDIDEDKNLFELGLDSLSLFGLRENIKKEFSIEIDMKDFYQTLNTLTLISKYIDSNSRVEEEEVSVEYTPQTTICQSSISDNQLIKEQLDSINNLTNLFSKQLDKLGQKSSSSRVEDEEIDDELIKNASLKMLKTTIDDLSLQQQEFIDKFILEYNQKHQKSKEFMIKNKNQVADWINTVIYRQTLKEINFPIVAKEAIGANFVDMDKNRYIDISMGYGSVFLGHNHPKVQKAMEKIIKKGFVLAPQTELIEEVASIIREFTNTQRVVFSNTGTEAVMAVVRAVRAVSKKRKVIKFQGSFHGTSDVILNTGDENSSYPTSIGINPSVADGMLEFQYGSPKIFEFIRENHQDIAGVLVEPIQSRRPDFQPREFLKQLREVTNEFDIALIFDEMITGFRCARGGVSEIFDIKPNISTFGKVVGGTMAIGIIAGDAKYLDAFDGGEWEFGDESFPQADMITFGGTFCKHPLTLSASLATLKVLKKNPNIQQEVNSKTDYLAKELNEFFTQNSFPIKLNNFGSLFRFDFFGEYSPTLNPIEIDMFFYMLIQKGVYTWEKRVCFLSASHTQSDLDFIIKCVRETLTKMRENGFFDKIKSDNLLTKNSNTIEATTIEATSLQKRLYILSQFENSSSIYNMYMGWQTTHLDIEKAQRVFREIIASNPSLRTNLFIKGDRVYQKISNYDFEIEVLEINSDIDDRILDFVNRDFDLSSEILFKVLVIKRRDDFIMVIKTHHTIFDGPSIDIVMDSFHKLYRGETITNPTKDYFDFTTIYNDFLKSPKMKKQEEFWLDSFSDTPPKLNLPIDKPYPKNRTFKSDIEYFEIDNRVTQKLKQSAKRYNVSINILLFSSFSILLNRLSSQNDIVIGVPVTLRDMEFSSVVGMFANSVAIRNKIDFDLNILEYFQTNQKIFLEMLDNIEYPFEELVERLNLKKDLARNALFDVMFIYEDGSKRLFDKFGFQKYEIKKLSSDFDLTLEVIDEGDTLFCSYEYYSEIFNPSTIKRFISYFIKILDEIQENKPLKDIDIISNDERKLLKSFNQTDKKYPKNKTIIELFENQVKKNPKEIAILYKNSTLSYDELNQKANSLGYYLREKFSIKADTIVAILMDRSEFMVISILAILKAGGAYLPIDPEYPKDRVEYMLSDSKTKLLICDRDISYGDDLEILNIQELSLDNNIDNLKSINSSDDLAYLIYTSGSTGQPKGVMITHQNVVGFSQNMEDNFGIKQRDSIYAITTISFDISVLELISSLLFNLKVIISSNNSIEDNLQEIKDNKIDIIQTTPSRFKAFLDLDRSSLLGVERLLVGGEALSPSLLDRLRELGCEIYNVYGPTEATVWSSFKRVDNASLDIGKPLFNESAYILDTNQNQLPIGAIGELHIGGDGLSRGYFNQDELTKEKFITHPILGRIYKTGDMARYKSSGDIEYLGRIDDQVKIRGYRIELGEIESAILGYTNIKESVVIANNQELVAYIVGEQKELKSYLASILPNYMIPSYFVQIDSLPLTPNGKVDKKRLPKYQNIEEIKSYIAPTTKTQIELSKIFSEVLKQDNISIDDNFLNIGGHSLSAITLVSKINQKLNSNLKIKDIFAKGSIKELADILDKSSDEFIYRDFVISHSSKENNLFNITNVQQAYLFGREGNFEMGNTSTHIYSEAIFSTLDIQRLQESLNILLQRHDALRLIFDNGKQRVSEHKPYTIRDNGVVDSDGLTQIRDRLSHKIYDISSAPLLDVEISQYEGEYIFHISIDALIMDGVSSIDFIFEWGNLYNNINYPLKPLDISFEDYMLSYTKVRESELFDRAKNYWLDKIYDYNLEYNLPYKQTPSLVKEPKFSRYTNKIDSSIWRELKTKAKEQKLGLTSIVLSVYAEVLCYFSNQHNFTLNLTLFNRLPLHSQIDDILGDFTVLELFNYKKENKSIREILKSSHDSLWEDLEHILYDGIDFQRDIRREFHIDTNKIVAPIVLTSILRGDDADSHFELNFDGYIKQGYAITQTPQVYLDNKAYEDSEGNFIAEWDFVEQIFSHDTIEAMHTLYCNLIEQVATSDWDMPLKALSLPKKDKNLIEEINTTEDKNLLKSLKPLHTLFEEQALKTPQNIAVIDEDGEYSYRDINNYANSIAIILDKIKTKSKGVAIYSQKGYTQVVSTLGVMKSGKFYLPLGKSPLARIRDILTEAKVDTLLVSQDYYKQIKELSSDYNILIIEESISIEYKEKELLSLPKVELDDIAYVIYTSGSTGKPKGVIATHKGASNTILAINEKFGIDSSDRAFGISELSFDLSVYDIFGMLSAGGAVVFPQSKRREEPLYWCELINRHSVTIYNSVPQLANLLYESAIDNSIKLNSLRAVLMSGDYIPITLPNIIKNHNDNAIRVMSLGGATEGTIWSIWYEIEDVDKSWQSIPYGVAMPNQGIYILNSDLTPCPIGVKGDLYITGTSVSLGYYEDKKRTNQAFISHPTLGYIYKTGDLGVLNERGYYEFRGRDDNQVKVRGFRVELGEIESIINQYPKIKNAIVILHNRQLIAYIVSEELIENELESYLKEKLPTYMIPTYFINMESMPLTPNGKIDKKALPNPQDIETHKESIAPTTPNQKELWAIFSEVLKQDNISIDDNFFELGGDSLSAISIITKISKDLNIKIELGELFSHPTIEALSSLLDSKNKIEYSDITPLPISSSYALSSSQTRLWALDKIESNLYAYNESFAIEFEGMIDLDILKHSLDILVNRHEILRTNFIEVDVEPRQIIREKLSESIYQKVEVENVEKYMQDETKRVFDLERDTLFYIRVINSNILFLNIHHIICDVWSIDIMVDELSTIYNALSNNKEITLPPLTIGYKDYSHWQNTLLEDDNYIKANRTYWHNLLDGHKVLEFPTDFKRASTQSFEGDSFRYIFDSKITKKIKELSSDNTLFITLLTLINILLSKYSNEEDILIGSPISNRVHQNLLNQIGFYLNTLPLRNILNPNSSFKETLESIKKSTLESFSHQTYPFDKLVDELNLERNLNQNPLFNIMLVVHSSNQSEIKFGDIKAKSKEIERKISKFDITLNFSEIDDNLAIDIEYNTSLFTSETIENLALNLETLIDNLTPNSAISEIDIVSPNQKEILKGFNNTEVDYPKDKTLIELFEAQVLKTPNNIALVYEQREITYQELNHRANVVGLYLRENFDIKPDTIVPLLLDRGEWMIVAILGVLKSGGAYLPIDIEYPKSRIEYILSDSQSQLLICDKSTIDENIDIQKIDIESLDFGRVVSNLESINSSTNLAYLIYTSGSTGEPKGVMVEHKGIVNAILAQIEFYEMSEEIRLFQFTTYSFDVSVSEIFTTLLCGATLITSSKESMIDNFASVIEDNKVNMLNVTPSFLKSIPKLKGIKTLITAGESAIAKDALEYAKDTTYINGYGPTETFYVSLYRVDSQKSYSSIPIGRQMSNIKIYILDKNAKLLPIGAVGELCVAGDALARGYLNRPKLTDEKFINHPQFGRMYKTGDIAKYQSDGNIEYLGRVDEQIKIRGFRVELGEIETLIGSYKDIKESVVIAKDEHLIAYIVGEIDIDALKSYLKERLPNYMIPSYFVQINALPLTTNGKIDKKSLPMVDIDLTKSYNAPQNLLQSQLCKIFEDVLDIERVGIDDNFFEIGGHSIKAIKIISKIGELNYSVSIKDIFLAPSIRELSSIIDKDKINLQNISIPQREDTLYHDISYGQKGLFLLSLMNQDMSAYNIPIALLLEGELDIQALREALKALIIKHEVLRTQFMLVDGTPKLRVLNDIEIDLDQRDIDESELQKEVDLSINHLFDIEKGSLFNIKILKISPKKNALVIVMHHILVDGWSMEIISKDIQNFYNSYLENRTIEIDKPLVEYIDFVEYQKEMLPYIDNQREYLLDNFIGFKNQLELPIDFDKSLKRTFEGDFISINLGKENSKILRDIAQKENKSLFALLVSVIDVLLYLYSKEEDIVIATPTNNIRQDKRFSNLVGYCLNTLAIKSKIDGDKSFLENFNSISMDIYSGFDNSDYPFDKLIEDLKLSSQIDKNPLFSVMVILQNFQESKLEFNGLDITPLNVAGAGSKFDLKFEFLDEEDIFVMIEYSLDLFKKETIEKMMSNLVRLFELISKDIDATLLYLEKSLDLDSSLIDLIDITQEIDEDF